MTFSPSAHRPAPPLPAWSTVALAGGIVPASAMLLLSGSDAQVPSAASVLAVGLMAAGIIGGAADGRLRFGGLWRC